MSSTTARLGLEVPGSTDMVSGWPADASQVFDTLDAAVMWKTSTLASRPAANTVPAGTIHLSTDTGAVSVSDGTNWSNMAVGSGPPVGSVQPFAGTNAPTDADGVTRWLICDGSAVSRTTYATLFGVTSTSYGAGDGSTTFNLPDLRNRFPMGQSGGNNGATGGALNHTHSIPALSVPPLSIPALYVPAVSVSGTAASHYHTLGNGFAAILPNGASIQFVNKASGVWGANSSWAPEVATVQGGISEDEATASALGGQTDNSAASVSGTAAATYTYPYSTGDGSTGASTTGSNNPPYLALNFIIRAL